MRFPFLEDFEGSIKKNKTSMIYGSATKSAKTYVMEIFVVPLHEASAVCCHHIGKHTCSSVLCNCEPGSVPSKGVVDFPPSRKGLVRKGAPYKRILWNVGRSQRRRAQRRRWLLFAHRGLWADRFVSIEMGEDDLLQILVGVNFRRIPISL